MATYNNCNIYYYMLKQSFIESSKYKLFRKGARKKCPAACFTYLDLLFHTMNSKGSIKLIDKVYDSFAEQLEDVLDIDKAEIQLHLDFIEGAQLIKINKKMLFIEDWDKMIGSTTAGAEYQREYRIATKLKESIDVV